MRPYLTKTPRIIQKIFKNYTWRFSSEKKVIHLTFDDGPTPVITNWTLDILKKYNAKATFFCIGKNVIKEPHIYQRILTENHQIGNHTHNHKNGYQTTLETYTKDIIEAERHLKNSAKLFRPPYGRIRKKQADKLIEFGYKIIMWDVLSADFDNLISKEKCLQNVLKNVKNGSIIVFHDSIKASQHLQYALPKVLEHFTKRGYLFQKII